MYLDFYGFRGVPQTTRGVLESRTGGVLVSEGFGSVCYTPAVFDPVNNTFFFLKPLFTYLSLCVWLALFFRTLRNV